MPVTPHRYSHDGVDLVGQIARPTGEGPFPAVLVVHEVGGLGPGVRRRVAMLAELGYVAFACDLYGGGEEFEGDKAQAGFDRMHALMADPEAWRARVRRGLDELARLEGVDPGRLAAIGYCFGGGTVLELARSGAPVKGIVSFHGLLKTKRPAEKDVVAARILVAHGASDPFVPWQDIDAFHAEMQAAEADWQLIVYGRAVHAFTNPGVRDSPRPGVAYDEGADADSWAAMQRFLREIFG